MRGTTPLIAALALVAVACGDDQPAADPTPASTPNTSVSSRPSLSSTPTSSASAATTDRQARKALRAAFLQLVEANTGNVDVGVPLGPGYGIRERGNYQIQPVRYDLTRTITSPDGNVEFRHVGVGDDTWFRLASVDGDTSKGWPCWMDLADAAQLGQLPGNMSVGPGGQPPAGIVAASYGVGHQFGNGKQEILGTTDLVVTLGLVGGAKLVSASGIDPTGDDTMPAQFSLAEGTLVGFSVDIDQIPAAITAAGGDDPAPEVAVLAASPNQMFVYFSRIGRSVALDIPPPTQVLEFSGPDDFETAMETCGRP